MPQRPQRQQKDAACRQQAEPHQRKHGAQVPGAHPPGQQGDQNPAQDGGRPHGAFGGAVVAGGQAQHRPHQVGEAHHQRPGDEHAGQGGQAQQPQDGRLLPAEETEGEGKVLPDEGGQAGLGPGRRAGQPEEALEQGGEEKAGHRSP